MDWTHVFRRLLFGGGAYHECRRCGTSLETTSEECPFCEAESIATYDFG